VGAGIGTGVTALLLKGKLRQALAANNRECSTKYFKHLLNSHDVMTQQNNINVANISKGYEDRISVLKHLLRSKDKYANEKKNK